MAPEIRELSLQLSLPLIKKWEGLRLKPYLCSAGVATIGYGSTFYLDGRRVTLNDSPITKDFAEKLLVNSVKIKYLPSVVTYCPTLQTPGQVAAITSWVYNLGSGALKGSTMRKKILQGDFEGALSELVKWNKAAGKTLPGLVARRSDEAKVFVFQGVRPSP